MGRNKSNEETTDREKASLTTICHYFISTNTAITNCKHYYRTKRSSYNVITHRNQTQIVLGFVASVALGKRLRQ